MCLEVRTLRFSETSLPCVIALRKRAYMPALNFTFAQSPPAKGAGVRVREGVEFNEHAVAAEHELLLVDGCNGGAGPRCSASLAEAALARRSLLGQRGVHGGLLGGRYCWCLCCANSVRWGYRAGIWR